MQCAVAVVDPCSVKPVLNPVCYIKLHKSRSSWIINKFLDAGVRNALISQFNSFDNRDNLEELFENSCGNGPFSVVNRRNYLDFVL